MITEIYEGGGFCLEYTPDDAEENEVICYDAEMLGVKEEDYDPEKKILLYKSDCKYLISCLFFSPYVDIRNSNLDHLCVGTLS